MTDLQLALLALGALIIVTVIVFNWWQERNLRNEISERFDEPRQDALIQGARTDDFRIDTDAVLKDDREYQYEVEEVHSAPLQEQFPATIPADDESSDYKNRVTEAVSAVAEFEEDMAVPVHELPNQETSWEEDTPDEPLPEEATTAELMEEAGLDEATSAPSKFWTDNARLDAAAAPSSPSPTSQPINQLADEQVALPASINHQVDLIALLYLQQPAVGGVLRELLLSLADLDKPIYAYGLGFDGVWCPLTREHEATEFIRAACSLQLADRAGQVSKEALNRFQHAVDSIGHKLGAQVEWQGNSDPFHYAGELDQFCLDVDKMVGFHLIQSASGPFTGTKFRGLAEAGGLVLREDGAFHYESEHGQRLFSVINQDNTPFSTEMLRTAVVRGITFQLDIPRVKNCAEVFNHMVLVARQMENSLSGQLVDDNQRALGEAQIEKIRQQLKMIHATMVARGIVPGSPIALRLFS
jgi:FtsZ-interacting cell division protein ZipA